MRGIQSQKYGNLSYPELIPFLGIIKFSVKDSICGVIQLENAKITIFLVSLFESGRLHRNCSITGYNA